MTDQPFEGTRLESTFVHLEDNGNMTGLAVDEEFWSEGHTRGYLSSGRLMGVLKLDAGASHWEAHLDGDELLYLLSGSMDVVLGSEGQNKVISLTVLTSFIVPRATWHQTIARGPCTRALVFLRIAVGVLFLIFAEYKVFGTEFTLGGGFDGWINRFILGGAYPFMVPVLRESVLPLHTATQVPRRLRRTV